MEDRSALFNQLKNFSQRKLKKVETKVVTASGEQLVEKRGAKGLQVLSGDGSDGAANKEAEPARKLDLQVGLVLPGFLIGSQDVAHDKSSLDSYGVTHILNLDSEVENKFEDDYNYKNISIKDKPDFELDKVLEDCFDFIDDGRHYGNVLIHCSGTIGLSRSTAVCVAYLMNKEKQKFDEAFNNVKEVRSFVKPNEGFIKQLKDYEVKLRGAQEVKDSGIDDPFALRKKQEIEQEKAMVAGAASVKNRMKMFGATLDTNAAARSKSVSPAPSRPTTATPSSASSVTSKWSEQNRDTTQKDNKYQSSSISKSMTPEPRKSWQTPSPAPSSSAKPSSSGPPPPAPPMPTTLHANDKSVKPLNSSSSSNKSSLPPPPPPPPGDLLKDKPRTSSKQTSSPNTTTTSTSSSNRKPSLSGDENKVVFGRRPPPPMKIRGGLSIERQDSTGDKNTGFNKSSTQSTGSSLQLPLKKQFTSDSDGEPSGGGAGGAGKGKDNVRAPSPSAALRAAKQQHQHSTGDHHHKPTGQLNRSSTKKLLNLIKTKTKSDLTLPDGDENDEIDALLGALENESIDNIDWDELGLDENEVKDIIRSGGNGSPSSSSDSSSSSSEEEDDDDEDEEEIEEVETSTQHYVIRSK